MKAGSRNLPISVMEAQSLCLGPESPVSSGPVPLEDSRAGQQGSARAEGAEQGSSFVEQ